MLPHEQTFIRLQHELINRINALFVFVAHPQVEPTNNCSERNLRCEAEVRKGGHTSKTAHYCNNSPDPDLAVGFKTRPGILS